VILYPQIGHALAEHLAGQRRGLPILDAAALTAPDHPDAVFTPTGGARAEVRDLAQLRDRLVAAATLLGYPEGGDEPSRLAYDKEAAELLHTSMHLEPSEASKPGVWEFLTCVVLSDLVRWRFSGSTDGTPTERFLAGRRNTFQRLWWRAFVLYDADHAHPYELLDMLGEDEVVQIMERPYLAGSRGLSRTIARELLSAAERHKRISRRVLIREAQKRLRRLAAFTSFEAIDADSLSPLVSSVFDDVAQSVK
jgi:hypothetical protein